MRLLDDMFKIPRDTPRLSDPDPEPFFRRHFWPPSLWGALFLAAVASIILGFLGALVYIGTEPKPSSNTDPAEQAEPVNQNGAAAPGETTTTKPPVLSPEALANKVAPMMWAVNTFDEAGRPSTGSAFAASSGPGQTLLLTSLQVVQAATRQPAPDILVRNGRTEMKAVLWTWQEDIDLALLVINRTGPAIKWAEDDTAPKEGDKLFVAVGTGGVAPGVIADISPSSVKHNIFIDDPRRGGPLLSDKGEVVAVASHAFNPGGAGTDRIFFGIPIRAACVKVLACGGGNIDPSAVPTSVAPPPGGTTTTPGAGTNTTAGGRTTTTARRGSTPSTIALPTTTIRP